MADDMTPGEIRRTLERLEQQQKAAHRASDDRLANLAQQMVPAALFGVEHKALGDEVKHLAEDVREGFARVEKAMDTRFAATATQIAAVVKAQEDHEEAHQDRAQWSRNKTLTVIGIVVTAVATIAAAWIAAVLAAKGVR